MPKRRTVDEESAPEDAPKDTPNDTPKEEEKKPSDEDVAEMKRKLEYNLPRIREFFIEQVDYKMKFVEAFMLKHAPPVAGRAFLTRAAEAPGLMQQWYVIENMCMYNVDTRSSEQLGQWLEDANTYVEYNGMVYRSAITLIFDYVTMEEVKSFQMFLKILYESRVKIEQKIVLCHEELKTQDAARTHITICTSETS